MTNAVRYAAASDKPETTASNKQIGNRKVQRSGISQ
jgi:hypothetical protein